MPNAGRRPSAHTPAGRRPSAHICMYIVEKNTPYGGPSAEKIPPIGGSAGISSAGLRPACEMHGKKYPLWAHF